MPSLLRLAASLRTVLRLVTVPDATATVPLAPPVRRSERALASAARLGFQISVLISFALLLGLLAYDTHTAWLASVKLAFGTAMMGEGLLLSSNWRDARRLTLGQLRRHGSDGRSSSPARLTRKLSSLALQLLGVIWLGAGLLTIILGVQGFF